MNSARNHFKSKALLALALAAVMALSGCAGAAADSQPAQEETQQESQTTQQESQTTQQDETNAQEPETQTEVQQPEMAPVEGGEVTFTFSQDGITSSGDMGGFEISGTDLTISASGSYTLTGSCSEGSVTVKKETTGVELILDGLDLTGSKTAPITCNKSTQVTITVVGNNTLTDNEDIADDGVSDLFEGAGIKVKSGGALLLTGDGSLTINGNCKNGIKGGGEATVTVETLNLTVNAVNNALAGDGSVLIQSGTLNLTAENDGIKAEPDTGDTTSAGTVAIQGGDITINAQGDGITSTGELLINGGNLNITTGGGHQVRLAETESAKGLKSATLITITGGELNLDCADDAIHSDSKMDITGGSFTIATSDDGIHADYDLVLGQQDSQEGPEILITSSVEGIEGATIIMYSGNGDITASDDGINSANADLGFYDFATSVCGGTWTINSGGDGLDSNRNVYITGGTTIIFGAENSGNAALDFDGSLTHEGGILLSVGMSGMAQVPTTGLYVSFGSSGMGGGFGGGGRGMRQQQAAAQTDAAATTATTPVPATGDAAAVGNTVSLVSGSEVEIRDSQDQTVFEFTAVKSASSVVFACDGMTEGETYSLYVDGNLAAQATVTAGTGQSMGGPMS